MELKHRDYILFFVGQLFYSCWIRATVAAPVFSQQLDSMMIQLITFLGALIILTTFIAFHKHLSRYIKTLSFLVIAILLSTLGTIFLGLPYLYDSIPNHLSLIGNTSVALGSGCILALIGEGYARITEVKAQRVITLFAIAGAFLLFLTFLPLSKGIALFMAATFPIVSLICLGHLLHGRDNENATARTSSESSTYLQVVSLSPNTNKMKLGRLLIYIVILSVPLTFLRMILTNTTGPLHFNDWVSLYALTFLVICATFVLEILLRKHNISAISIAILLLVSVALLLFFFFDVVAMVPSTLLNAGYALFVGSFYCYLGSFIITSKQPPFRIFALGCVSNTLGLIIGWILGLLVKNVFVTLTSEILMIALMYIVFFTSVFALPIFKNNFFSDKQGFVSVAFGEDTDIIAGIQRRCAALARAHALSNREEEILVLLIRGMSLRLIANELTLSQNTIKTHVAHIHSKLDVHNREELLRCFKG
jgi:DNA-binding CsgD family transcriptional regulator